MAASVQFRPQNRDLGMVVREVDEDLAIFLGMRNGEKEKNIDRVLILDSNEFDDSTSTEPKPDCLLIPKAFEAETVRNMADNDLLNLENDRSDYDGLLMQHDTSLISLEEVDGQDSAANQADYSNGEGNSLKSEASIGLKYFEKCGALNTDRSSRTRLSKACEESDSATNYGLRLARSASLDSSSAANRRPSSSGGRKPTSRAATPTGRPSLVAKSKPSRAPTPTSRAAAEPSRASSRATLTSEPVAGQVRTSTPPRVTSRSSTPASRPTISASSKSASRSATPTRKPATPPTISSVSSSDGSSSRRIPGSTLLKNPVPTCVISQTVKPRPPKASEMLSLSRNTIPKTSLPRRPASASRGRPSAPATLLASSNGKSRQKSWSPAKVRVPNGTVRKTGNEMLSRSRGYSQDVGDEVNPVVMGTKMVERVVNMRKLAPPKQEEKVFPDNPKKSSQENSGFGRSLSKRSLDMAIRHMDIRRSISDDLRPAVASSV